MYKMRCFYLLILISISTIASCQLTTRFRKWSREWKSNRGRLRRMRSIYRSILRHNVRQLGNGASLHQMSHGRRFNVLQNTAKVFRNIFRSRRVMTVTPVGAAITTMSPRKLSAGTLPPGWMNITSPFCGDVQGNERNVLE